MYPVVVLRASGGALSSDYTSLAEDLASHGYVVVSIDAPYRTVVTAFPDGRVVVRNTQSDFDSMPYAVGEKAATQAGAGKETRTAGYPTSYLAAHASQNRLRC